MKAIPPFTFRVLIQKNWSFPRPDGGYTTAVRHHVHELYSIQRNYFRIYRTVTILVLLHWSLSARFYSICLCRCYEHVFKQATFDS